MLHFSFHMFQVTTPLAVKDHFSTHDDEGYDWNSPLDDMVRSVAYAAFLVVVMMIVALIVKLLATLVGGGDTNGLGMEEASSETDSLLPKEAASSLFSYGACDEEEDVECGKSSYCSTSSHDDLYDGTICVICFDDKRNSFFVPCGHCVACCTCAHRILEGESKTCPICRRLIQKVSKLFVS